MAFTYAQKKALSIIPHVTGPFSFVGSVCIIVEVIRDRSRWNKPYHRLLFAMAFFDALSSVALGLSTWPIPAGSEGVYAPLGTQGTCSAQAFFIQANIASPMYNFCLSLYYLLLVKYSMSEAQIQQRIEPWMHGCTIIFGLGTSVVCLGLGMFNNSNLWCWINALPRGCEQSYNNGGETTCTRGDNAEIFRWLFFFAPLWAAIFGSMVAMYMLWKAVRTQEEKVAKWTAAYKRSSESAEERKGGIEKSLAESVNETTSTGGKVSFSSSVVTKIRSSVQRSRTRQSDQMQGDTESPTVLTPMNNTMKRKRDKSKRLHRKSNMVMWQAFRYVAVFWVTWLFGSINRLMQLAGRQVFWIMVLHALFVPLQGGLNFLVYKYPVFYRWKEARRKRRAAKKKQRQEDMGVVCVSQSKTSAAYSKRFSGISMEESGGRPSEVNNMSRILEEKSPEA